MGVPARPSRSAMPRQKSTALTALRLRSRSVFILMTGMATDTADDEVE